jgi:hypothetical protein
LQQTIEPDQQAEIQIEPQQSQSNLKNTNQPQLEEGFSEHKNQQMNDKV